MDAYTGTQESVNTVLRQAGAPDRAVRALQAGQGDGDRPQRPGHRDGAVVHPRRRLGEPARAGRRLRDVRGARPPLRPAAGRLHRRLQRQPAQDLRAPVPAGDRGSGGGRRQRRAPRRDVADRVRREPDPQPGVGRQDRHHRQQHVGVVHGLHPQPLHRRDGRRREPARPLDHPERPDHRRHLHRRRPRLHHGRPDVVRRDEPDPAVAARRDVHPAERPGRQRRPDHGARRGRRALRPGRAAAQGRRLPGGRRWLPQLRLLRRHRRLHQPGRRHPDRQRHGDHDLPLERHAVRPPPQHGHGRATATATATDTATATGNGDDPGNGPVGERDASSPDPGSSRRRRSGHRLAGTSGSAAGPAGGVPPRRRLPRRHGRAPAA